MGYVVTGFVCFWLGLLSGAFLTGLCAATTQEKIDDNCHGCFGAAFGDCDKCPKERRVNSNGLQEQ